MNSNQCSSSRLVHLLRQFHDRKREQTFSSPDVGELFALLAENHLVPSGSSHQRPIVRTVASSYSMFVLDHVCFEAEHRIVVHLPPVINDLTTPTCKDSCRQIVLASLQPEYGVIDYRAEHPVSNRWQSFTLICKIFVERFTEVESEKLIPPLAAKRGATSGDHTDDLLSIPDEVVQLPTARSVVWDIVP